jgi:hypothetical protein
MYVFPIAEDEADFFEKENETLTLKTYGLPYIFWIYALCSVAVIFFMFMAIKAPVLKLIALGDETDALLGYSFLSFVGILPVFIFAFFFYEKRIIKHKNQVSLVHKVFGITVFKQKFVVEATDAFSVESFLTSPNVARMQASQENLGFQNKGYFVLWLKSKDGKRIRIDRHSRKADMEKLKALLDN